MLGLGLGIALGHTILAAEMARLFTGTVDDVGSNHSSDLTLITQNLTRTL
jgi:hypothetical protein